MTAAHLLRGLLAAAVLLVLALIFSLYQQMPLTIYLERWGLC
ncbi:hypothetical protein [Meridianimarinicoccus aquatilis]|nr:hypothetical protein [Fluviibacterium aquatile]